MATIEVTVPANSVALIAEGLDTVYVSTADELPLRIAFGSAAPVVGAPAHPFSNEAPFSASGVGDLNAYLINPWNRAVTAL